MFVSATEKLPKTDTKSIETATKIKKDCKVFCYDSFFSHLKRIIAQNGAIFKLFGENYARNMKKAEPLTAAPQNEMQIRLFIPVRCFG